LDIVVCGDLPSKKAPDGTTYTRHEWYSLTALNGKLKHFPAFAAFANSGPVADCEGARRLADSYDAYSAAHPNFDEEEPLERSQRPRPAEPQADPQPPQSDGVTPDILGGLAVPLPPVVALAFADGGFCTGTFIAKNWIVTAAHCLVVMRPELADAGSDADAPTALNGQPKFPPGFKVTWFGDNGKPINVQTFGTVVQYASPHYIGFRVVGGDPANDMALIYIPRQEDGRLPPNPDGPPPGGQGPFMRISLSGKPTVNAVLWGAGQPNLNTNTGATILEATEYGPAFPLKRFPTYLEGTISNLGPFDCGGDSGGPLVDLFTIPNDPAPQEPALVSTLSASGCPANPKADCGGLGGADQTVRADVQFKQPTAADPVVGFVLDAMRQWNGPTFSCNLVTSTNNDPLLECWGKSCLGQDPKECPEGQACSRPGSDIGSCSVCSTKGSCSCVVGQCLPSP
jgi:hypothetical protein